MRSSMHRLDLRVGVLCIKIRFRDFGLNGIVYNIEGYLLLVLVVRATHVRCLRLTKKPGRRVLC
ncbi:unnamed protein product [Brassica oleracea]